MPVRDVNRIPQFVERFRQQRRRALATAGAFLEGEIKQTIQRGRPEWAPLKPATVRRKRSSKPLIDTGKLLNSITHQVSEDEVRVGVFGEYAVVAAVHEFGAPTRNIPQRAYMRPTFDENKDRIFKLIAEILQS